MLSPLKPRNATRQAGLVLLAMVAVTACQRESTPPVVTSEPQAPSTAPVETTAAQVDLKDVIETDDRYVVGIS